MSGAIHIADNLKTTFVCLGFVSCYCNFVVKYGQHCTEEVYDRLSKSSVR